VLLHYHDIVKHKFSKITKVIMLHMQKNRLLKQFLLIFFTKIKLCLVLHKFLMFVNKSK